MQTMLATDTPRFSPLKTAAEDYETVRQAIAYVSEHFRDQPEAEAIARAVGKNPRALTELFRRWCGLTPKEFLQAVTLDHARKVLRETPSLLEASFELGLSGPGRLHDLFVVHEAMSPGEWKTGGAGMTISYGFHPSPFGTALVLATERGLCGLAFADQSERAALEDMRGRWPNARLVENKAQTLGYARRVFEPGLWRADQPLRIVLIGTDFEVRVWETLLTIPLGGTSTYGKVAKTIGRPKAARAVGAAVGKNPVSFVVPCHRVIGANGALTGYHWGLTRKRAMLGWEVGRVQAARSTFSATVESALSR
jgi:AraC family transcriptional regulator, regulatory protein of adaptative response / methylated-DNA-[protein]-cysteine methyltransferase